MWPSGPSNSLGLAHVDHLHVAQMFLDPMRLHLPDAGEGQHHRPQSGTHRRREPSRPSAFHVGRHGDVDLLGMRQAEILHIADEIVFRDLAADARIEFLLLATLVTVSPR